MTEGKPSGWAIGWTAFAGLLMIMMGFWWILTGSVALLNSEFYVVTQRWILQFDVWTWGWIHMILGIVILAAGCGVLISAVWARIVGVIVQFAGHQFTGSEVEPLGVAVAILADRVTHHLRVLASAVRRTRVLAESGRLDRR